MPDSQSDNSNRDFEKIEETGSILIPKIGLDTKINSKEKMKDTTTVDKPKRIMDPKKKKILLAVFAVFVVITAFFGILFFDIYQKGMALKDRLFKVEAAAKSQDLQGMKAEIANTKKGLESFEKSYKRISFMKVLPYFGNFVKDGQHAINAGKAGMDAGEIVIAAAEPYADIIGFSNSENATGAGETTQDRIDFIVKTIPDLLPKTDGLIEKANIIKEEVDQIDPDNYPERAFGHEVRPRLKEAIQLVDEGTVLIQNSKPLLEVSPYLLGVEGERTYLVIFQNDKELRPTGGFITAYSIAKVNKGKFEPVISSDIYSLDNNYKPNIKAPDPLVDYLKGPYVLSPYYRLRDMNWSPDFAESMEFFIKEAEEAGIEDIDGIIAVDTHALVNLLNVIGPIAVPGYGDFSTNIIEECDCPQVVYELESFADIEGPIVWSENEPGKIVFAPENYDNRKKIIGPLMNSILSHALGQPKEKMPALFEAGMKSVLEKNILLYMFDEKAQNAVSEFGIGGRVADSQEDYLLIVDANLGGRKSNLYVTQEVLQEIKVDENGNVLKTLTISYKNPAEYDGWLNSVLPNWVRVYVPEGSELMESEGLSDMPEPYSELGKTVYAGFFELRPLGVAKVKLTYKLPFTIDDVYNIYLQKQPGKPEFLYTFEIGNSLEEVFLNTDKELKFDIK